MNMCYWVEHYSVLRQQTSCKKDACLRFCHLYWYQFTYFFSISSRKFCKYFSIYSEHYEKKKKNCWYSMAEMCEITSLSPEGQEVVFCMKYRKKIFFTWSICKSKPSGVIKSVTDLYFSPSQLRSKKTCPEFHLFSTFYLRSWVLYTQFNKFESSFICQSTPLFAISLKDIGIFLLSVQDNNIGLNVLIIKHK